MTLNFKLGGVSEVDPAVDDMSRTWVGFSEDLSDQEVYEANRGLWLLGARANGERVATFSFEGTVRVVVAIDRIETIAPKVPSSRAKRAIIGQVLSDGDATYEALIRREVDGHRNPVSYIDDPAAGPRTCACGCGGPVPGHRTFLPGHDQRAVHDRITRQWGSTLGFIDWFDTTYPAA